MAEVKTISITPPDKYLTSKQMDVVLEDLERLKISEPVKSRYLIVLTEDNI